MKKIKYLLMLCAFTLSISSCVDKDFDFTKIDDSDITIGDSYSIPIGSVELNLSELWDEDLDYLTSGTKSDDTYDFIVPTNFSGDIEIGAGFDATLIEDILNTDNMTICIAITNSVPELDMDLDLGFSSSYENVVNIFENLEVNSSEITAEQAITKSLLTSIADSNMIHYSFVISNGSETLVNLSSDSKIEIKLTLKGEGGVKLF